MVSQQPWDWDLSLSPIWNSTTWHTVWNWYDLPWAALDMENQRGWLCRRGIVMQSGDGHELFIFIKALVIVQAWILVVLFMFAQNHGSESAALKSTCWLSCWHLNGRILAWLHSCSFQQSDNTGRQKSIHIGCITLCCCQCLNLHPQHESSIKTTAKFFLCDVILVLNLFGIRLIWVWWFFLKTKCF